MDYVSRAGEKLHFALNYFQISVTNNICADFGSNVGGFVGVLLNSKAKRVYSVDTSYGTLDWNLRNNPKVVVLERSNAMHITLPEKCDFISVDVGWTPQHKILPNVKKNLSSKGVVVSLVKPHYEAKHYGFKLNKGVLSQEHLQSLLLKVKKDIESLGFTVNNTVESPILGKHGGNREYLFYIQPTWNKPS